MQDRPKVTQAEVKVTAPKGATATDITGKRFTVRSVEFRAYEFGVHATAYGTTDGGKHTNTSWALAYNTTPDWFPAPPAEFTALAQRIAGESS